MITVKVQCPSCGATAEYSTTTSIGREIGHCDPEEGGCDKFYAFYYETEIKSESYKIEGMS